MKTWHKAVGAGVLLLVGVAVGVCACLIHSLDRASVDAKQRWFICVQAHQPGLRERAESYRQKVGHWPTSIGELVEARFLPEWSQVHLCPSAVGMQAMVRTSYQGSAFIDENRTGVVAHYTASPYRFRVAGDKFTVQCGYDAEHNK
jgi:hypothetical protein